MSNQANYSILVVDDVETIIDILVDTLGDVYNVSVARNGKEALEAVAEYVPDLILLDIIMPGMDGYEVCRRLKANTANIPVIFITVKTEIEDETLGFEVGGVDYITKPFNRSIVQARVKTHLLLKTAREELERQNEVLKDNLRLQEQVDQMYQHDLKNPLQLILLLPEFLLSGKNLTDSQRKGLQNIRNAGFQMLEIINKSLDLFKIETGRYNFEPKPVNIVKVLQLVCDEMMELATKNNSVLDLRLNGATVDGKDAVIVNGEELLYCSMLANLLKNSIEASPPGQNITIEISREMPVGIRIRNQGAVPEQIRPQFFEKFVTAGKTSGTGLGTYSAKLMAQTLGCELEMATSDTAGTTLTVLLPS